jgi:hypothetical protein
MVSLLKIWASDYRLRSEMRSRGHTSFVRSQRLHSTKPAIAAGAKGSRTDGARRLRSPSPSCVSLHTSNHRPGSSKSASWQYRSHRSQSMNAGAAFRHTPSWLLRFCSVMSIAWVASPPVPFCGQVSEASAGPANTISRLALVHRQRALRFGRTGLADLRNSRKYYNAVLMNKD